MCYFWCTSTSCKIPHVPKIQPQEFSSLDSSSFHKQVTAKTDLQGRKYDGIVLYSNVGNKGHSVQGRDKEVEGVGK